MTRFTALLLLLLVAVAVFGGGNAEDRTTSSQVNTTESGYPIVSEPLTLEMAAYRHPVTRPFEELEFFVEAEEVTGVRINWRTFTTDLDQQKTLMLASGDLPDAFFGRFLNDQDIISNPEYFHKLDEFIGPQTPNIVRMFELEPTALTIATSLDGHIYSLPKIEPLRPQVLDYWFINQQWLDNLGLDMPTTTEEFRSVLRAFRDRDANGNGDPNDEIPLTAMGNDTWLFGFMSLALGPFGLAPQPYMNQIGVANGAVYYAPARDEYRQAMAYMHSLYDEGLIDPEIFTQDGSMLGAKIRDPDHALVGATVHWTKSAALGPERAEQYEYLLPLEGPNGDRLWRSTGDWIRTEGNAFSMTTATEYPEVVMRWIDYFYDQEVSLQMYYGPIGVAIEKHDDNTFTVLDSPDPEISVNDWVWTNSLGNAGPKFAGREIESRLREIPTFDQEKIPFEMELRPYLPNEVMPALKFSRSDSDELAVLEADLKAVVEEKRAEWIIEGGIEEEWDDYIRTLNRIGLARYIDRKSVV